MRVRSCGYLEQDQKAKAGRTTRARGTAKSLRAMRKGELTDDADAGLLGAPDKTGRQPEMNPEGRQRCESRR
ncbi:hypothetical protein CSOJ01_07315 [Colletotrichum sojae]|uniref:Uncharacterized protein n=1 Tax=Colletotrichum sojae TaxID=2175907 RepID=A0A8H6MTR8_9PEZI|nr:hypothetical protein CSOJ01_07315 [Colletotrichum sojae]